MSNTTLWHVYADFSGRVIVVADVPQDIRHNDYLTIRSITPRAAGRRYIRNNLARALAESHYETDNIFSHREYTDDMADEFKGELASYTIRAVKTIPKPRRKTRDRRRKA